MKAKLALSAMISLVFPSISFAAAPEIDSIPPDEEPVERRFVLAYNPFTLQLTRASLNVEAMIVSHHVIGLTGYYASTTTNSDSYNNVFRGPGGEIGYRYYSGQNGPRGFFVGPSLLVGHFDAIPQNGASVGYWNLGGALDAGWQAIVVDRWVVGLGAGLQYNAPVGQYFPPQELPASVYARPGLRPRLLLALGVAF